MGWKRKAGGGVLGLIGFMLSPLSWWNDLFVNVPLAIGFGWLVALIYRPAFEAATIVGYWLTNVLGLMLLHKGLQNAASAEERQPYSRRILMRDLVVACLYTLLLVLLVKLKLVKPIASYFSNP